MQRYFGPQGILAQKVKHFEFRPGQQDMANAVLECIRGGTPLLAEAGTGTGKTWAYIVPAILSGKKVIVSTGTKTLQDQILDHDIPLLRRLIFPQLSAVCLKGRRNYLCRRRFHDFSYQPTLWNKEEAKLFRRFQKWATRTNTGDRAEIDWLPDRFHTWNEVSSNSDQCLGQGCEEYSRCFLGRARSEASRAHLIVVNHHLFLADLALRHKGLGEVIPDYDAVIFDEAHQLEDIIGLYFGIGFNNLNIFELAREILKECRKDVGSVKNLPEIQNISKQMEVLGRLLYQGVSHSTGAFGRFPMDLDKAGKDFLRTSQQAIHALERLKALLGPSGELQPVFESYGRRCTELAQAIREVLEQRDRSLVYWYELNQQAAFFHGTPVQVDSIFRDHLLNRVPSVVLTSATLSAAGSFEYIRQSLGLPEESKEVSFPSPFAYDEQAVLYIPSFFPLPHEKAFCGRMAEEALEILARTRGRALFLFTSYRHMNEVYLRIRERLPYPLLMQGQKPKRALLAEFKERIDSVLLATSSFWQGVDVPGEALSCLLIDKLPFEVPDDPLMAARMQNLAEQGKSPFFSYQVPRAAIQLKQGVGRLIRSTQDRGIIIIFDTRLIIKGYGRSFIKSLPSFRIVQEKKEIDDFLLSQGLAAVGGQEKILTN